MFLVVLLMSARVHAETAKELFAEGKRLYEEGKVAKACAKFEASVELDPRDKTQINLATCWEKLGRTASAWTLLVKIAGNAKNDDIAAEARKMAKDLRGSLVHLTIEVPTEAELEDLVITRGDKIVDREQWGDAVPVDPDEYTITAKAPGHEAWSKTITIKSKDKTVEVPKLERLAKKTKKPEPKPPDRPNPNRALSIGLLAGGGGAIAIATGLAFHSRSLQNESDVLCPTSRCGNQRGVDLNHRARLEGWIANVGWGLGGGAVIAAIVTWRLGVSKSVEITPAIDGDRAGVAIGGRF